MMFLVDLNQIWSKIITDSLEQAGITINDLDDMPRVDFSGKSFVSSIKHRGHASVAYRETPVRGSSLKRVSVINLNFDSKLVDADSSVCITDQADPTQKQDLEKCILQEISQMWAVSTGLLFVGIASKNPESSINVLQVACLSVDPALNKLNLQSHTYFNIFGTGTLPGPYNMQHHSKPSVHCVLLELKSRVFAVGVYGCNPHCVFVCTYRQAKFVPVGQNHPGCPGVHSLKRTQSVTAFERHTYLRNSSKGLALISYTGQTQDGRHRYRVSNVYLRF